MSKKDTKDDKIYETRNYTIFKDMKGNRPIKPNRKRSIKSNIEENDLDVPIIVNEKMEILEGQHTKQVREEMGLPIKYLKRKGDIRHVMKFNSISSTWTNREFLDSYCLRGYKEYQMLAYFVKEYGLGISFSLGLLVGKTRHAQADARKNFMDGQFKVKNFARADEIAQRIHKIGEYVDFNRDDKFMRAIVTCMSYPEFDWQFFLKKLESKSTKLRKHASRNDYLVAIERFYNHGTSHKKRLQFDLVERGHGAVNS